MICTLRYGKICRGVYTELIYAIFPTLFSYFSPFRCPCVFLMFLLLDWTQSLMCLSKTSTLPPVSGPYPRVRVTLLATNCYVVLIDIKEKSLFCCVASCYRNYKMVYSGNNRHVFANLKEHSFIL